MIRARSLVLAACVALLVAAPSCAALDSWDQFSGPSTRGGGDASVDAGGDAGAGADADRADSPGGEAGASIAFVQANAVALFNMSRKSLDVPFNNAQSAGDLNVVVVGWYDLNVSLLNVVDSIGNHYLPAGATTSVTGPDPIVQATYYAPRIAGAAPGVNIVTATWDSPACEPDVRVAEFHGVDTLDVTAESSGLDGPAAVAAAPTKFGSELLVAGGTSTSGFTTADPPFTLAIVSTGSDIVEYRIVSDTGGFTAAPPLVNGKSWVMQLATFH